MSEFAAITLMTILFCPAAWTEAATQQQGKYSVAGLDNDHEVEQFFVSFKDAIAKGDKKKVAAMIDYPINAYFSSGRKARIKNELQLLRRYDEIFHRAFKQVILETKPDGLWAKWSGVATPRGEIWFSGIQVRGRPNKYQIKIIALNGPIGGNK